MNAISKYRQRSKFYDFVNQMVATIKNEDFTATELRQAAILASIIVENKNYNTLGVVERIECLEALLKLSDKLE